VRRELERLEVPGEHEARERAWTLVQAAYAGREPQPHERTFVRPFAVAAALAALAAAALSPPGRAVLDHVRVAIGVERSDQAILQLPTRGRLLVNATTGPWIVGENGSRRSLGPYDQASWSPQGLYVVASRGRELFALTPRGGVRWAHSLPGLVDFPRWAPSGFRIAYFSGGSLRVIAGDGEDDRMIAQRPHRVGASWRPGAGHVLAYASRPGEVTVVNVDTRRRLWKVSAPRTIHQLAWAPDGSRLLVLFEGGYSLRGRGGEAIDRGTFRRGVPQTAAFAPRGHRFALVVGLPGRAEVRVGNRLVFAGAGAFNDVEWSPDGRWIIVSWGTANQWVFVRSAGVRRIAAISNVSQQFNAPVMPALGGWCCS
jgi:hypothetical protein